MTANIRINITQMKMSRTSKFILFLVVNWSRLYWALGNGFSSGSTLVALPSGHIFFCNSGDFLLIAKKIRIPVRKHTSLRDIRPQI
jgi:hypothetical protein